MLAARCFFYRQQFLYGCLKADFFLSSPSVSTDSESYSLFGGMKRLVACAILTDFTPQQGQNKEKGERDCKRVKTERRRHDQQRQAGKYERRSEKGERGAVERSYSMAENREATRERGTLVMGVFGMLDSGMQASPRPQKRSACPASFLQKVDASNQSSRRTSKQGEICVCAKGGRESKAREKLVG